MTYQKRPPLVDFDDPRAGAVMLDAYCTKVAREHMESLVCDVTLPAWVKYRLKRARRR